MVRRIGVGSRQRDVRAALQATRPRIRNGAQTGGIGEGVLALLQRGRGAGLDVAVLLGTAAW